MWITLSHQQQASLGDSLSVMSELLDYFVHWYLILQVIIRDNGSPDSI